MPMSMLCNTDLGDDRVGLPGFCAAGFRAEAASTTKNNNNNNREFTEHFSGSKRFTT